MAGSMARECQEKRQYLIGLWYFRCKQPLEQSSFISDHLKQGKTSIMNLFHSLFLGILQGLTEFIPVSSTAHLLIGQVLLGIPADDAMFSFLVLVQLGTILSLIIYFWKDLLRLLKAFFAKPFSSQENKLAWYILFATIPALVFGYLLRSAVTSLFKTPLLEASIRLLITAIVLALAEWFGRRTRSLEHMTWLDAILIGLAQVLSIFPGASRSGTTIAAGMARNLDRPSAARFTFLMSVPVMIAAGGYQSLDLVKMPGLSAFLPMLLVGFLAAAIVGWLAVHWLIKYLSGHSLYSFSLYCAILGVTCLVLFLI
jgi:undecaprenyl-diphosphatase